MSEDALAEAIFEDRRPRGLSLEEAMRMADAYRTWLAELRAGTAVNRYDPDEVERLLDRNLQRVGRMSAVYGPQEKGKTNLCAVVTEAILACRPWEVYSNVPYPWQAGAGEAPPRLHLVESLSELMAALSRDLLAGKTDAAVILDEFDQVDDSHSWAEETSESWSKFVNLKRHYAARGPLVVFHALHKVPLDIRSGSTGSAYKLVSRGGEHLLIDLEDPSEWVSTVPRSALPHLTYGLRGFKLDVDVEDLQSLFSGPGFRADRRAVAETTLRFLREAATRPSPEQARAVFRKLRALQVANAEGAIREQELVEQDLLAGRTRREIVTRRGATTNLISAIRKRLVAEGRLTVDGTSARSPRAGDGAKEPPAAASSP